MTSTKACVILSDFDGVMLMDVPLGVVQAVRVADMEM